MSQLSPSDGNAPTSSSPPPSASTSYQPKPAAKQVTLAKFEAVKEAFNAKPESGGTYNIWYENYAGADREQSEASRAKRETRCDIARDSGYTKADIALKNGALRGNTTGEGVYCCIHFARGCCPKGVDCMFLHRLPRPNDFPDQGRDCFGRERQGDYKDDMSGVGSLQKVNRTLYVGRIQEESGSGSGTHITQGTQWRDGGKTLKGGKSVYESNRKDRSQKGPVSRTPYQASPTERVVRRHFSEWGEIERVLVLHGRSCAFVTYKYEANGQFAKEAMLNQSLDHDEILNVRWATEDPNPGAQKRNLREMQQLGKNAIVAAMNPEMVEAQHALQQLEYESRNDPEAKRRRIEREQYEEEMNRLDEENQRGWEEYEREKAAAQAVAQATAAAEEAVTRPTVSNGLLDSETMSNLQALHVMRQKQKVQQQQQQPAIQPCSGLGSLADYGSDSDQD